MYFCGRGTIGILLASRNVQWGPVLPKVALNKEKTPQLEFRIHFSGNRTKFTMLA